MISKYNYKMIIGINSFSHLTEIYSTIYKPKFNAKQIKYVENELSFFSKNEVLLNPSLWR